MTLYYEIPMPVFHGVTQEKEGNGRERKGKERKEERRGDGRGKGGRGGEGREESNKLTFMIHVFYYLALPEIHWGIK